MIQPIDYRINVAQPMAGAAAGIQTALQMSQQIDAGESERARGDLFRAQTAAAQDDAARKTAAAAQAAALRGEVERVAAAPSSEAIGALMLKHPHLSEGFQRALNSFNADEQKARVREGTQVYAAIVNGEVGTATSLLRDAAATMREGGKAQQAAANERLAALIDANPAGAQTTVGMMLASAMGADKFRETFADLEGQRRTRELEPSAKREAVAKAGKAESDAASAAVAAKYAESNAAADLTKKGWDITKLQEDIKIAKLNAQIAAADVTASREGNSLKRKELGLKIEGMKADRDKATSERAAEATGAFATVNETENLLTDLLSNESRSALKSALGASGWMGWVPGTDARTATGKIERLVNILASANLDQLKGAMTDKDIQFLRNINANMDRFQSEDAAIAELKRINGALGTARRKLTQKYGQPPQASGGAVDGGASDW